MIQNSRYALPSALISEVAVVERVFPLPLVPGYVRGLINRYSTPYALIDIGLLLFNIPSGASKTVVLKESVDKLAFLIDDVLDIADIARDKLLKVEQESEEAMPLIESSFEWQGGPVFCIGVGDFARRIRKDFEA
jgi:purine-binding chemotaxis protein CheW